MFAVMRAARRRAIPTRRFRAARGSCALLACVPVLALNPTLDVNQYAHQSWRISDGFCKGTIHQLAQTEDGYLWLATEFGLLRFDGVRTVAWEPPRGEHLPSNDIRSIAAAHDGTLWLGTAKGLVSWKSGRLIHYPELDGQDVHTLWEDRDGTLWASGTIWETGPRKGNSALCAIAGRNVRCYGRDGSFGAYGVTAIYQDTRGSLWLGAANGIWHWKPGKPVRYPVPELQHYGSGGLIFSFNPFAQDRDGALLVSGPRKIARFNDGKLTPYSYAAGQQFGGANLLRDRDGSLWIGTADAGLMHVRRGKVDVFDERNGLSSNGVVNFFEDREGNIWITTINGLDRFREYPVTTISVQQGLSSPFVRSVLATKDGSVWLATPNGLNRWQNGRVTIYTSSAGGGRVTRPNVHKIASAGLPDNDVGSLYEGPEGRLWVSTAKGLAYFDSERFTPLPGVHLPSWSLSPVARDRDGNLWITSDLGLYRISGDRVAEYFPPEKMGLHGLLSGLLVPDAARGGMWLASWEGGVAYVEGGQVRELFASNSGLGAGRVNALDIDGDDALWAATDGGLSRIKDGRVATLTSKNGLPCDTAHGVIQDNEHSLWVYMACGLVRIQEPEVRAWIADAKRQIRVTAFDASDGVKSHSGVYNFAPRMAKDGDGRIWFAPVNGVSVVDPHYLSHNSLPPPVHVERVTANRKSYDLATAHGQQLNLPPRIRDLSIEYTALSFVAPEKVRFRFKLEGQDSDWREVVNDREVQYSNLAPGTYRFRVKASNNSGVWNQTGDTLAFTIAPAFYQTGWFSALVAGLLLAGLWSAHHVRVKTIHRRNRNLALQVAERTAAQEEIRGLSERLINAQEQERTRIARELHDDFNQEIAAITLKLGAIQRRCTDQTSTRELQRVRDDLKHLSGNIRELSHELHPAVLDYCDLSAAVNAYCNEFSTLTGVRAVLQAVGQFEDVPATVKLCVYRITQEALRNVAKHAETTATEVQLLRSGDAVLLSVRDRGVGFSPDQARSSRGLGLVSIKERVRLAKGTVEVQSEPQRGTTIVVHLPIGDLAG